MTRRDQHRSEAVSLALVDLEFARDSHLKWAEHLEAHSASGQVCPECDARPYKLNAAHEREWVAKYDRIIAIVKVSLPHDYALLWKHATAVLRAWELKDDCVSAQTFMEELDKLKVVLEARPTAGKPLLEGKDDRAETTSANDSPHDDRRADRRRGRQHGEADQGSD